MYQGDISDKEWAILEPHVAQMVIGRPKKHNIRMIVNAIRYILRGSCQWRMLPKDFPPWKLCMTIFSDGVIVVNWKNTRYTSKRGNKNGW